MQTWGFDSTGIQVSSEFPTGQVAVSFEDGEPSYEILTNQAYDHIQFDEAAFAGQPLAMLYHGSLAWRSPTTRSTILKIRSVIKAPVFIDLNIRHPWFDSAWLPELLQNVEWLKLNLDELQQVSGRSASSEPELVAAVSKLREQYNCAQFFVTAGSKGAYHIDHYNNVTFAAAPTREKIIDTVGAGDAFTGATIAGLLEATDIQSTLNRAVNFAANVCTLRGATSSDVEFYN